MARNLVRTGLAFMLFGVALLLYPTVASAHEISGRVVVDCSDGTVTVTVSNWSGNVEIKKLPSGPVTDRAASGANGTAVFAISTIGGNGSYTVGRQGYPTDPTPVAFTINCTKPTPTPTPTLTPTPTPTPTARPTPTVTGSLQAISSVPTPTGGVLAIEVPSTGGSGTSLFTAIGSLFTVLGVALVASGRRLAREPLE